MDLNKICNLLEKDYNVSVVDFYIYNNNYVLKAIDKSKDDVAYKYFLVKDDTANEIRDKVLIDYFSKDELKPSDIVY